MEYILLILLLLVIVLQIINLLKKDDDKDIVERLGKLEKNVNADLADFKFDINKYLMNDFNKLEPVNTQKKIGNIKFTDDQAKAIDGIIDFIAKPFDNGAYIVGLTGAGGTGKTFVTDFIIRNCKYSLSVIQCASPTHKACRVFSQAIGGKTVNTIQSVFGFRLDLKLEDFNPASPQFNPISKPKLENVKLLIIDEASMLPAKLVTYICNVCKKLQIKIIFIGDSYQLAPVNEKKSIAFDRCSIVYELNQIVRQGEQNPIVDLYKNVFHLSITHHF